MMVEVLDRVIQIVADHSGIPKAKLSSLSAIDQDIRICGDDISELAESLAAEFGDHVWQWPWQRFADLNEPNGLQVFVLLWRLLVWPFRRQLFDPSPYERLEIGHIAAVIERGQWFEP